MEPKLAGYYLRLPREILETIIKEREQEEGITIQGDYYNKIRILTELDRETSWVTNNIGLTNFEPENYPLSRLVFFITFHNIPIDDIDLNKISFEDLVMYVKLSLYIYLELDDSSILRKEPFSTLMKKASKEVLKIFAKRFKVPYLFIKHANVEDFRNTIKTGSNYYLRDFPIVTAALKEKNKEYLEIPYDYEYKLVKLKQNFSIDEIQNILGIVIPSFTSVEKNIYILSNLPFYINVLSRKDIKAYSVSELDSLDTNELLFYFSSLKDIEIFKIYNVFVYYTSRKELVENMVSLVSEENFMLRLERNQEFYERSKNKEILFTAEDIRSEPSVCVLYGTLKSYHTYTIEELNLCFSTSFSKRCIDFVKPNNINETFPDNRILYLKKLITCVPSEESKKLLETINQGFEYRELLKNYEKGILFLIGGFSDDVVELIKSFLKKLFIIGMYMRRWKGPGHKYPLRESETLGEEKTQEINQEALEANKLLEKMGEKAKKFCMGLRVCIFQNGEIKYTNYFIEDSWERVFSGEMCIRMESSKFIVTAYFHLKHLFKIEEDINLYELELIS